ncbi:MAG TPA: winged helix-turn-helix domain-containing protein [Candidatus Stackebrandtia faecavium]|nr:winged helix-turn-helix domain-containing protein [Candidatus Stackebrandtia faecavium]
METTINAGHLDAMKRFGYALSDNVRASILLQLRHGPKYPSDLADTLNVSRQVMSNHLSCLRGCGLVNHERVGKRTKYAIADPRISAALEQLLKVTLVVDPNCCDEHGCTC